MTPEMAHRLVEMAIDYVAASSLGLFIEEDGVPRDPGTGTCIRVRDRFLVATAAHNVRDDALSTIGLAMFEQPDPRTPHLLGCDWRGGGESDPVDIAWIEIHPGAAAQVPKRFLSIECMRTGIAHAPGELAFVHGFPRARIEPIIEGGNLVAVTAAQTNERARAARLAGEPSRGTEDRQAHRASRKNCVETRPVLPIASIRSRRPWTKAVDPRAVVTALQTTLDAASAREDGVLVATDPQRVINVALDAHQPPESGLPGHSGPGR